MPHPDELRVAKWPTVRPDPPNPTDPAFVTRPIFSGTGPGTATVTEVASSLVVVTLLVANVNRITAAIFNDSAVRFMFIKLGAGASTVSFTTRLGPRSLFELPMPGYTGIITAVWSSIAPPSFAHITELS